MPQRKDPIIPGGYYHIFNRGINGAVIFRSERNYLFFLRRIEEILTLNTAKVIAYVLMPTHYHLLIQIQNSSFSAEMGRLINSYTKACNQEWDRTGPLFEGRFKAKHINTDQYVLELSRYIHLNPVFAHLVDRPEDWPFSSYLGLLTGRELTPPVSSFILSYFNHCDPKSEYQNFVEEGLRDKLQILKSFTEV